MLWAQILLTIVAALGVFQTLKGPYDHQQRLLLIVSQAAVWLLVLLAGGFDRIVRWP